MNRSNRYSHFERRQRGLTLVELMVSLALSLVLMVGALQLFSGSKETYRLSDSLAAIQENGRYALELLARDIRQTGFTGCIAAPDFSNLLDPDHAVEDDIPWQFDFARPVFGYEGSDDEVSPSVAGAGQPGEPWAEADAIHVLFGDPSASMTITGPDSPTPSDPLEVDDGPELEDGQIMLVTDCRQAALFRLTDNKPAGAGVLEHDQAAGNCTNNLHGSCDPDVDVTLLTPYVQDRSRALPLRVSSYFIGNTQRDDTLGNPIPALYRQTLGPAGLRPIEELVEGVSDLQIRYGVADVDSRSAERYLRADQMSDADAWDQVVSVRVDMTVQSVLGIRQSEDADAELFQQTFSTTIALRNRTL